MVKQPQEHVGSVSAKMVAGLLWQTWQQPTITRSQVCHQNRTCYASLLSQQKLCDLHLPGDTHTQSAHLCGIQAEMPAEVK